MAYVGFWSNLLYQNNPAFVLEQMPFKKKNKEKLQNHGTSRKIFKRLRRYMSGTEHPTTEGLTLVFGFLTPRKCIIDVSRLI